MRAIRTAIALTLGLGFGAISAGSAAAAQTFDFKGTCSDCAGNGLGVLTVQDYTSGPLTSANFVSFSYSSNLVNFTLTAGNIATISGNLNPADGGRAYIDILQLGGTGWEFAANADGSWSVSSQITDGANGMVGTGGGGGGGGGGGSPPPVIGYSSGADIQSIVYDFGPSFDLQPVPEPSAWALMLLGFGGLGATLRGKRRAPADIETA